MTIEEKAKAYDEALEKLRSLHDNYDTVSTLIDIKEELEYIFPELKLSEDKRIRETLVGLITWASSYSASGITTDEAKEMIAWLETQGQVKESPIFQHENKMCKENDDSLTNDDERIRGAIIDHLKDNNLTKWAAWLEKQGEQKPTEWSLPYGKNETAEKLIALAECLEVDGDCLFNGLSGNDYGKFLRVLAIKLTQSQQDWSGEDEKCLSTIIAEFSKCAGKSVSKDEWMRCNDFLHFIRDRVKPKQDWSEEDEDMRYKATAVIHRLCAEGKEYVWSNNTLEKLFCWLKSLKGRYTWKPSDEQIEAIRLARSFVTDDFSDHPTLSERLIELEEQLKKLSVG